MARTIQGILGPLIRVSASKVSLVHQSAKEFCLRLASRMDSPPSRDFSVSPETSAEAMASACIHYLLLEEFRTDLFRLEESPSASVSTAASVSERSFGDQQLDTAMFMEHDPYRLEGSAMFRDTGMLDLETRETLAERNRFFDYAALYWTRHYSLVEESTDPELRRAALRLLDPPKGVLYQLVEVLLDKF